MALDSEDEDVVLPLEEPPFESAVEEEAESASTLLVGVERYASVVIEEEPEPDAGALGISLPSDPYEAAAALPYELPDGL